MNLLKKISTLLTILLSGFCVYSQTKPVDSQPMKNYDYVSAWKQVKIFEDGGLPESALKAVNEIYRAAKTENNAQQLVKSVVHQLKFTNYKEENAFVKNLIKLKDEANSAPFPVKNLLHSMLAEMYWQYYQNNRWKFSRRTETVNFNNEDIETWSLEKIIHETIENYQLSLANSTESKTVKINLYDEALNKGNEKGRSYRPTLFDFLAHRAVDFYMGEEPAITKPAYAFSINNENYLSDNEIFTKIDITSKDTLAYKFYALKIFQELISFHLKDENPEALIDIDLKRLQFVKQHLTLSNKTDLYLQALEKLEQKTIKYPVSTIVTYHIALVWVEKGNLYNPLQSEDHKWDLKNAVEICEAAKMHYHDSDGDILCENLKNSIQNKLISAKIEKVNVPDQPFRALIHYKNFTDIYYRIIKTTPAEISQIRKKWEKDYNVDQEEKFIEYFASKTALKSGKYTLPTDKDYQQHSIEIKLDAIQNGDYMVLFSNQATFQTGKNGMAYGFTTVSNISYIHRPLSNGSTEFYVMNRQTGEPMPGTKAEVFFNKYNYKTSSYDIIKKGDYLSDGEGKIIVPYKQVKNDYDENNFYVIFSTPNDKLSTKDPDNSGYYYGFHAYPQSESGKNMQTYFFLDRAIYRPGQTVYFKGIVVNTDGKTSDIVTKYKTTVQFFDVNHQLVGETGVTTNEYGTFSGTFTTPTKGLTGQMYLSDGTGEIYFSVEEYKRPKFEVVFEPVKGNFTLSQTVKVTGKAQAYSGANIDGATVKFRVVRKTRFPYWWFYWYGYYPASPEVEIANGSTLTDQEGKYTVDFKAIPDLSVNKNSDPVFNYSVYVDVTDINGETHSSETTVNVGYKSLQISTDLADLDLAQLRKTPLSAGTGKEIVVKTLNLMGEPESASVRVKIVKLKTPSKAYRNRFWEKPDKFLMNEEEFHKNFPLDLYQDENNVYKWEAAEEVKNENFDTEKRHSFLFYPGIKNGQDGEGSYRMEITAKDKDGQEVKEVVYFNIIDSESEKMVSPVMHLYNPLKILAEPGENASVLVGSSEKIRVLYEIEQDGKIIHKEWLKINNKQKTLSIPIIEEYRGNIGIHYVFIKNNRLYTENAVIAVPYTNKMLDIQFETFRDKLLPGQQEQWKLKIIGKKAEKVAAEMVATLYDASLDVFRMNAWYANFYGTVYNHLNWSGEDGFNDEDFRIFARNWDKENEKYYYSPYYDNLNWFGYSFYSHRGQLFGRSLSTKKAMLKDAWVSKDSEDDDMRKEESVSMDAASLSEVVVKEQKSESPKAKQEDFTNVKVRTNFNETAFFFPHLQTNENGEIIINFTIPEALTRWKMLGFAHTKDLKSGFSTKQLVTQKDLMVVPNQPRFFRENDKMTFSVKISSLVDEELSGQAQLEFFDALTMKPVDDLMKNKSKLHDFKLKPKQSTNLEWNIEIPEGLQAISYRVVAKSGNFSDGEEMVLPVVTNRMLITETLPLPIRGNQEKEFKFEKLANNTSKTLKSHRFTLEFTSNPAWYAVQALPYMMEYPYECVEQTFSRYYANSIASHIANSNPKIKQVFDTWKNYQPDALLSNLEKNQELKTALLEETPWVLQAKDESQRKRTVALLFDLNRMADEMDRALDKVLKAQTSGGGFTWFPGFPEDRYMTQHIIAGLGHLDVMGIKSIRGNDQVLSMATRALAYLDAMMQDDYERLKAAAKKGEIKLEDNHLDYTNIHYLYVRSYFKDIEIKKENQEGFKYFLGQSKKYWLNNNLYMEGMIVLALHRFGEKTFTAPIIKSLSERALHSEEMGMYWKNDYGYYWYQAPIETHALMIEVYDEVADDKKAVEDLKVWLLKQKQTQDWKTTKATSEACFALLRRGMDVLASDKLVEVTIGGQKIDPTKLENTKIEAGTGYFKTEWTSSEIKPTFGFISVKNPNPTVAWGAVYWQYFEQLDKIKPAETPLKLKKQLFLQQNTDRGPVITPITETTELNVGDLVKVRIELRVDRTMEYVHLKDMRAAGLEPVNTISTHKYQDGLWYYESTRDLATNFFMGYLPKGTYVFEYPLRVSQKGDFSNGVTTIQCMYAPEFSSHSEGVRIKIGK